MTPSLFAGCAALALYLWVIFDAISQLKLRPRAVQSRRWLPAVALVAHLTFLYLAIFADGAQNLNLFNMISLTAAMAVTILLVNSYQHDVSLVMVIVSGLAALSTASSLAIPPQASWQLGSHWASLVHIMTAMASMGVILLAALQATLVSVADKRLRQNPTHFPASFPPLQSLETFLFQLIVLGFVLMSISLVIAIFFLQDSIAAQPLHKSILSSLSWLTFAILLIGHKWRGWRGSVAAKWTLTGFVLLSIGYFGSKLVIEFILT